MGIIQLLVLLLLIGFILWAVNYLFGKYIHAEILELANKLALVLAFFGAVPAPPRLW